MTRLWFALALSLLGWQTMAADLKVQTFNTYGPLYARHLDERTTGLLQALEEHPSDIFGFQEVWDPDHGQELTYGLKNIFPHLTAIDFDQRDQGKTGLRIFADGSLLHYKSHDYPINVDGFLDRIRHFFGVIKSVAIAKIALPGYGKILIANTHTHPLSQVIRISQVIYLAQIVMAEGKDFDHLIVMGDFNFTPDSLEYQLLTHILDLKDGYFQVHGTYSLTCTYCDKNPYHWGGQDRVIDYVFYRSLAQKKLDPVAAKINLKGRKEQPLSDHFGVQVTFKTKSKLDVDSTEHNAPTSLLHATLQQAKNLLIECECDESYDPYIQQLSAWLRHDPT